MTRIPPSITKVFNRIAPAKSTPERQRSKTTGQLASPQKTVRFADDVQIINQQHRTSYQADPQRESLIGSSIQDARTTSKKDGSKPNSKPHMPIGVTNHAGDDIPKPASNPTKQERDPETVEPGLEPAIKRKHPDRYNAMEAELQSYFDALEKEDQPQDLHHETATDQFHRISTSVKTYDPETMKPISLQDQLDSFLDALEMENTNQYNSSQTTPTPKSQFSSEQQQDAISDIHLQRINEKNV